MNNNISILNHFLQELLKDNRNSLTEKAFIFACKNEDLTMLQILIHSSKNQEDAQRTEDEEDTLNNINWRNWLFGSKNVYTQAILQKQKMSTEFHQFIHAQKLICGRDK